MPALVSPSHLEARPAQSTLRGSNQPYKIIENYLSLEIKRLPSCVSTTKKPDLVAGL